MSTHGALGTGLAPPQEAGRYLGISNLTPALSPPAGERGNGKAIALR